jgi:hypothetical protein
MHEARRSSPVEHPGDGPVRPLVFVHVPKAAGTSLKAIIARAYAGQTMFFFLPNSGELERFRALPPGARGRVAVVAGHEPWGLHGVFAGCGRTPAIITALREPVARVLSLFRYIHGSPEHAQHERFVREKVSLERVYDERTLRAFDNHQVRYLAGPPASRKDFGALTRDDLEQAKRHLSTGCRAFGLQERFEASVAWFARELRWGPVGSADLNRGEQRARPEDAPPAERALIERHNTLDLELYEFASDLFTDRA